MLRDIDLLESARQWIIRVEVLQADPGVMSTIELSPPDRDPRFIGWILESSDHIAQIVIWSDGQSEIDLAEVASGEIQAEHRQINQDELVAVLGVVQDWVIRKDSV